MNDAARYVRVLNLSAPPPNLIAGALSLSAASAKEALPTLFSGRACVLHAQV